MMSPCDEYLELISARLDGELSPFEEKRLEAHLAQCAPCRELADQLADLHDAMSELPRLPVPDGLTQQIAAAVAADKVTPISAKKKSRTWRSLASLAAVLALAVVGTGLYRYLTPAAPAEPAVPSVQPEPYEDSVAFTMDTDADAGLARTALFPDQEVLALCAADLFPNGKLAAEPVYDPDAAALSLELAEVGALTLRCTQLEPEGVSTVELTFADGTVLVYLVDLTAGTVIPAE